MMRRHVSAQTLASFNEGDLSDRKAARISSHLAGCPQCAALRDDVAKVPVLLASTEAPPLPDHLAARIQTALMTESARRVSLDTGADQSHGSQEPREHPARHGGSRSRPRQPRMSLRAAGWAAAAAVVAAVGGGAYLITAQQGGSGSTGSASANGAGRPPSAANVHAAPANRNAGPGLDYGQAAGATGTFTPIATGTDFRPDTLVPQVQGVLTADRISPAARAPGVTSPLAQAGTSAAGSAERFGSFSRTALEGCVTRIAAGHQVVLVDVATYQGAPAAVIVTAAGKQGSEQAWAVGAGCSASNSDVLKRASLPAGS
jgi:hypothetical protein